MTKQTIAQRLEDLSSLKLALGTDLLKRIDKTISQSMYAGMIIGGVVGAVAGSFLLPYINQNPEISILTSKICGAWFTGVAGAGLGAPFGSMLGSYRVKRLESEFPEQAEYIREYELTRRVINSMHAHGV